MSTNAELESDEAKTNDLYVHIGSSEVRGNLPVQNPEDIKLYKEVSIFILYFFLHIYCMLMTTE